MNKDFLNLCYKFFNRFITSDKLVKELENFKEKEIIQFNDSIKEIIKDTPNTFDEYVKKEKETTEKMIKRLEEALKKDDVDFLKEELKKLKKKLNEEVDSHDRWEKIFTFIIGNDYFNKCFDSLSKLELLEFIIQYIRAPMPPRLDQEEFDELVLIAIEKDEREWLWRLAFNYDYSNLDFDKITNYFIKVNDGYYISELICAVSDKLNIDDIIDKINDEALIKDILGRKNYLSTYITDEQFDKLSSKLKK